MLDITASEFILIVVVILLVVGPQRLAETVRRLGRFAGQIRSEASLFRQGIQQEIDAAAAPARDSGEVVKETAEGVGTAADEVRAAAAGARGDLAADFKEVRSAMQEVGQALGSPGGRVRRRPRRRRRF